MPKRREDAVRPTKTPKRAISDRALIRELFIQRLPLYPLPAALRLTRTTQAEVDAAIAAGEIATDAFGGQLVIPWDDVAKLALDRWTPRMISGALGSTDRLAVVPLLNRFPQIEVFLPVYQIRLLHYLAEMERGLFRARLNASDVLEVLSNAGVKTQDLFTPRTATALKDVQHTLWINDLRVVVSRLALPPDVVAPAWMLQRQLGGNADEIPDLLAIRKPRGTDRGFVLACEIDLGAERLKGVFLPKLARLVAAVQAWAGHSPAAILILTRGGRRAEAIRESIGGASSLSCLSRRFRRRRARRSSRLAAGTRRSHGLMRRIINTEGALNNRTTV